MRQTISTSSFLTLNPQELKHNAKIHMLTVQVEHTILPYYLVEESVISFLSMVCCLLTIQPCRRPYCTIPLISLRSDCFPGNVIEMSVTHGDDLPILKS